MEGIIGFVSCLLCSIPFFIIAFLDKNSSTPITFWSGDKSLKAKVTDLAAYNKRMAKLYYTFGLGFLAAGLCCLLHLIAGIAVIILICTVGFYFLYRSYKKILTECSHKDKKADQIMTEQKYNE